MKDEELVSFYSKLLASKFGGSEDVRADFASWAVMKVMEGWDANPENLWRNYCLKDYAERHFEKPKTSSLDAPLDESDEGSRTLHEVIADRVPESDEEDDFDPEREIDMVDVKALALQLMPERERVLIQLKESGVKKTRVCKLSVGTSKSRKNRMAHELGWDKAWMAFKRYDAMLAAAYAMKLREAVGQRTQIDTRLEIQWLTMP